MIYKDLPVLILLEVCHLFRKASRVSGCQSQLPSLTYCRSLLAKNDSEHEQRYLGLSAVAQVQRDNSQNDASRLPNSYHSLDLVMLFSESLERVLQ